jgi:hypothetical protein
VPLTNKQRRLYERARAILLDETPQEDAHERIGLLTVVAGIRPVALFLGVEDRSRLRLERVFRHSDVRALTAPGPTTTHTWEPSYPREITELFRKSDPRPALWLCRGSEHVTKVKGGINQVIVGKLLGYPDCCIDAHQAEKAKFESAVIAAYIRACGEDPQQIAQALLQNLRVEMEWEDDYRVPRTTARFPFVQHIACGACLSSESSPTAILNSEYRQLVEDVDRHLSHYLLRIAKHVEDDLRKSGSPGN